MLSLQLRMTMRWKESEIDAQLELQAATDKENWGRGNDSVGCGTVTNPHGALEMFICTNDNAPTAEMLMTVREIWRAVMRNNQCKKPLGTSESKGTKDTVLKIQGRKETEGICDLKVSSWFYHSRHKNTMLISIPLRKEQNDK